ncbi:MAG: hypothetical protein HPY59_07790 [Anaerolineae bacterium]|nr:hypothetical protein [Anaerolineae bacterium]
MSKATWDEIELFWGLPLGVEYCLGNHGTLEHLARGGCLQFLSLAALIGDRNLHFSQVETEFPQS